VPIKPQCSKDELHAIKVFIRIRPLKANESASLWEISRQEDDDNDDDDAPRGDTIAILDDEVIRPHIPKNFLEREEKETLKGGLRC
jgi:hypothetical protein